MLKTVFLLTFLSLAAAAQPAVVKSPVVRPTPVKSAPVQSSGVYFVSAEGGKRLSSLTVGTPFLIHLRLSKIKLDRDLAMVLVYHQGQEHNQDGPAEMSALHVTHEGLVTSEALSMEEAGVYVGYLVDGMESWSNPPRSYLSKFTFTIVPR